VTKTQFEALKNGTPVVWMPTREYGQLKILSDRLRLITWDSGETTVLRVFQYKVVDAEARTIWDSWYEELDTQAEWDACCEDAKRRTRKATT